MSRLDDVISRVRSGDKTVFTDTSTQAIGQTKDPSAQAPQLTGSRLDQIISRVKSGDKSVFTDHTTNYTQQPQQNKQPLPVLDSVKNKQDNKASGFPFGLTGKTTKPQQGWSYEEDELPKEVQKVNSEYINKYIQDMQSYAANARSAYENAGSGDINAFLEQHLHDTYDLKVRGDAIKQFLDSNPGAYASNRQSLMDFVTNAGSAVEQYRKVLNETEDKIIEQNQKEKATFFNFDTPAAKTSVLDRILFSGADAMLELAEGAMEIPEKVVDAGAWLAGTVGGLFSEDFRKEMDDFAAKDLYDSEKLLRPIDPGPVGATFRNGRFAFDVGSKPITSKEASYLGEKSDALLNSLGQMIVTKGAGGVVPWWVTTGVTAFGSGAENALQEGASHWEAGGSAAISAAAEVLTEKLFGGSGLGEKGLINLDPLTKGISNKLVQTLAKYGVDMATEGVEEVISEFAGNLGSALYREENLAQLLVSEEALQSYLDAFVGGAIISGAMNAGSTASDVADIVQNNRQEAAQQPQSPPTASEIPTGENIPAIPEMSAPHVDTAPQTDYDNINNQGGNANADTRTEGGSLHPGGVQRNPQGYPQREVAGGTADGSADAGGSPQSRLPGAGNQGNVYTTDSEGVRLTPEQNAKLQGTAIADSNGAPLAVYHTTDNMDFTTFEKGDTGFHFGSKAQSVQHSQKRGYSQGRTIRAYLNIKNPVQARSDIMSWTPRGTALYLWSEGILTDAQRQEIDALWKPGDKYDSASAVRLRQILQDMGYDGIAYPNGFEGEGPSYMAFRDDQIIRAGIEEFGTKAPSPDESVGAAPAGFDPLSSAMYKYGNMPEGENPARTVDLPMSMDGKSKVSRTARTVAEAKATTDEFAELIGKEVVKGGLSYIPIKNSETTQKAVEHIQRVGWDAALEGWSKDVHAGKTGADMSAVGALLLNNAANAGDRATWLNVLHDYQLMGTATAQGLQALRILKQLAPSDKLYMLKRSAEQMVNDMHLGTEISISEELQQEYDNAKTDEARDKALKKIQKHLARQIPSTTLDKWTALRYVNMLGNLRTQIRNVAGNAGMKLVSAAKNAVAAGIENLVYKASGGKLERTKSFTVSKAQLDSAKADFDNVKFAVLNGGKYADSGAQTAELMQAIQDQRTIFKSDNKILNAAMKPMEGYRKVTNWAMEAGDLIFSKSAYARALAGYLKAHGVTGSDFSGVDTALMDDARLYAIKEAQEQTFRDTNWLSGWISKVGRRKDTPKAVKAISEGVMPFRKTPANVLVRAEEYSPLGIINSVYYSVKAAQNGSEITGAQVINSWAKTITGSGIFGLGMLLYNLGMLSTGDDEDEKKESFDSMNGWQNYALVLPDGTNLTIDFLTPEAMPLLMGAELMKQIQDGGFSVKDMGAALTSIAEPMVQMSMLQGVSDTLDNIQYAEDNMGQLLINAGLSYLTQGLTNTLAGQLERSFEDSRMQTFVDKGSDVSSQMQRFLGKASAKTPGWDYQQIPYINAWGEEEKNPGFLANLAYNTLSPSYIEKGQDTPLTRELNRLNEALPDTNTYPSVPDKTLSYTDASGKKHSDYVLSADEWTALAKAQGQTQKHLVEDLIGSDSYQDLPDEYKAAAIKYAYTYARETARSKVLSDYAPFSTNKWMSEISGREADAIVQKVTVDLLIDGIVPEAGYKNPSQVQKVEAITGADDYFSQQLQADAIRSILSDSMALKYDKIIGMGYSNDDFATAYRIYEDASGSTKKADAVRDLILQLGISKSAAEKLYDAYSKKAG